MLRRSASCRFSAKTEKNYDANETLLLDVATNPLISALIGVKLNEIEIS